MHWLLGGALYILAILQYALAQVLTAAAWNPPYSWLNNYISDLGNTACGTFAVPRGTPAYVCSPLNPLMNTSFVLTGVLLIAGTVLLWRFWPTRKLTTTGLALLVVSGLGKLGVGLVPENTNISLHTATAFNIPIGGVAVLLLSLAVLSERKVLAVIGLVASILGLVGTVLSGAAEFVGPAALLGLGVGGMERVAGYPVNVWMIVVGTIAVMEARRPGVRSDNKHAESPPRGSVVTAPIRRV